MDPETWGETLDQFLLNHAALVSDADAYDERAQIQDAMTLHAARGWSSRWSSSQGWKEGLSPAA